MQQRNNNITSYSRNLFMSMKIEYMRSLRFSKLMLYIVLTCLNLNHKQRVGERPWVNCAASLVASTNQCLMKSVSDVVKKVTIENAWNQCQIK